MGCWESYDVKDMCEYFGDEVITGWDKEGIMDQITAITMGWTDH